MNPYTLLVLAEIASEEPRHVIDISFLTRLSNSTIYKACRLGYLERTEAGYFWATDRLLEETHMLGLRKLRMMS